MQADRHSALERYVENKGERVKGRKACCSLFKGRAHSELIEGAVSSLVLSPSVSVDSPADESGRPHSLLSSLPTHFLIPTCSQETLPVWVYIPTCHPST